MLRLLLSCAIAIASATPFTCHAEDAKAVLEKKGGRLTGAVSFVENNAGADKLIANSGGLTIEAKESMRAYGAANSEIEATGKVGKGDVHCADVVNRAGDSMYLCYGPVHALIVFVPGVVIDNPPSDWDAAYSHGAARLVLEINQPGVRDDIVWEGEAGLLTVRLVGGVAGRVYNVDIAEEPINHTILHDTFVGPAPLETVAPLTGPYDVVEVEILGNIRGPFKITAKARPPDDNVKASTSGNVVTDDDVRPL